MDELGQVSLMMETKKKPKRGQDTTRTKRQGEYLDRLTEAKGKRLVVDLDATGKTDLEALLTVGYGANQAEVVRNALRDAVVKISGKKT